MEKPFTNPKVLELLKAYRPLWAIGYAQSLMGWDLGTYMPPGAARERGEASGELRVLARRLLLSPELLSAYRAAAKEEGLNDYEAGVVRVLGREIERAEKIPPELIAEEARAVAEARVAWERAKAKSDFSLFKPHLERIVGIARRKAELLAKPGGTLYDALLDLFEEGLTVRQLDSLFGDLAPKLSALYAKILDSGAWPRSHPLEKEPYEKEAARSLNMLLLGLLGYPFDRGRLDETAHPFTQAIGRDDVRITTSYHGRDIRRTLGGTAHEFGHALYELQVDKALAATPIGGGVSLGVHEGQSRFWENIVWRTPEFTRRFYPSVAALVPAARRYTPEEFYRYIAMVRPETIRIEADEVQYPLHIVLRYEVEKRLIDGDLRVDELPQLWNSLMEELLHITPPDDAHGVLQDVHWSLGLIGYFPTYALGSMLAAQMLHAYQRGGGSVAEDIEEGRLDRVAAWQREKIHRWGATYPPQRLIELATGEPLNPRHYLEYLEAKYLSA